ncbi:MAG: dihydrofolate reductase [Actinomycetales bacterium]|nr:MAG: dihydrofolate reductase [Actinomycetales bacterium]
MATVFYTATTLDGFLATPDHSLDWLFAVEHEPGLESDMGSFTDSVGALVMGAATYRWVVEHEDLVQHPEKWREWYGDRPTWVFTHREQPVVQGAHIRFTQASVAEVHAEATAAAGDRDVWLMGGGDLVGQHADVGLLDRIVATVAPVTLGAGAPLLPRVLESDRLTLTDVKRSGQLVTLTYDVGPPA